MTIDNTQELDEIMDKIYDLAYDHLTDRGIAIGIVKIKQSILGWHNKQTLELLDRLESNMRGKTVVDTAEGWKEFIRKHVNGAIEAERNKLNNSDGE